MAKQRKRKTKSADELNSENEFLKMKMMAEFGGEFVGSTDIPLEVENAFLKQIEKIQRAHADAVVMPLYEIIGKPEYSDVHDLSDKEIEKEYNRLVRLMDKKGISFASVSNINKRELYRFITQELFKREVESIKLKGWKLQFVYEDFYPNHRFDVTRTAHDALLMFIDKGNPPYQSVFDDDMRDKLGLQIDFDELISNIRIWQSTFRQAHIEDLQMLNVHFNDDFTTAHVECEVVYSIQPEKFKRHKSHRYNIEFWLHLKPETGWWLINRVNFEEL